MKTIAIIPARGGSKRIPKKNIKDFHGKPIIQYSLTAAKNSLIFDHIHVSTDDDEIFNVASKLGFAPKFYRDSESSSDIAPVRDVLKESLLKFAKEGDFYDVVCLLSATAPLIDEEDLKSAFNSFVNSKFDLPLLAVSKYPVPIEWALKHCKEANTIEPLNKELFFASSHGFKDMYYDIGSFAFFTRKQLLTDNEIKFIPFVLPLTKSIDIDTLEDWRMAEELFKLKRTKL